jgi:FkbH-like protein
MPFDFASVKLCIWDLDDTYWTGTLTEGPIELRRESKEAVIALSRQGIVNSICSNNDLAQVRARLEQEGSWGYFVLPAISWGRKPEMVKGIIEAAQLRPQNVLFIDDKPRIRVEVMGAVKGLLAAVDPSEFFATFRTAFTPASKPADPKLKRLGEYKILERKVDEKAARGLAPQAFDESFLKASNIRCELIRPGRDDLARIHELITRTNQLNFTKSRLSKKAVAALIGDPARSSRLVRVRDCFGDYGICGFVATDATGALTQLLFSCRILQMGVEQAVYRYLGSPSIRVAAGQPTEAARELQASAIDATWVTLCERQPGAAPAATRPRPQSAARQSVKHPLRVVFIGDCTFQAAAGSYADVLQGESAIELRLRVTTDAAPYHMDFWAQRAVVDFWAHPRRRRERAAVFAETPWLAPEHVAETLESAPADVYVVSLMQDYFSAEYRHERTGIRVPYYYFQMGCLDITRASSWPTVVSRSRNWRPVTEPALRRFSERFSFVGPATPRSERQHLQRLLRALPARARLILVNSAQVTSWSAHQNTIDYVSLEHMVAQGHHHAALNQAVDELVRDHDQVQLVDVRRFVNSEREARDPMHYGREAYHRIGVEILAGITRANQARAGVVDSESVERAALALARVATKAASGE